MEEYPIQASRRHFLLRAYDASVQENYVHWTQTPEFHLYTAELAGVRKDEIRVEVEDSRYLVIRTEWRDDCEGEIEEGERRRFMRKFRLPQLVDVDGISAGYEEGVLTVTVPRFFVRGRLRINPNDIPQESNSVAPAA